MSKKTDNSISGIVMIVVFLALYYGSEKIEWLNGFDKTMRGIVLLAMALVLFLIVKAVFAIKNGGVTKEFILQNAALLIGAVFFVIIALLLRNTNISEDVLLIPWIGIPVLLMILSSPKVRGFIRKLSSKKNEEE